MSLRAAALNHLDVWVRKGLPSVPKPRILGADGAGVIAALGEGVDGLEIGQRVVVNPGIPHDGRITVIGEHTDGTYCELKTSLRRSSIRSTTRSRSRKGRVFRSCSRPRTACSSPRHRCTRTTGCSSGVSAGRRARGLRDCAGTRRAYDRDVVERGEARKARALGADLAVDHADADVVQAVKDATGGVGANVVVETVGEATWERSLAAAAQEGRVVVCGATSGHSRPPLPAVVEAARGLRLDDGHAVGLRGRLRAHPRGTRSHPRRQRLPARRGRGGTRRLGRGLSSARSSSQFRDNASRRERSLEGRTQPKPRMNLASSDMRSGVHGGSNVSSASTSLTPGTERAASTIPRRSSRQRGSPSTSGCT